MTAKKINLFKIVVKNDNNAVAVIDVSHNAKLKDIANAFRLAQDIMAVFNNYVEQETRVYTVKEETREDKD